MGISNNSEYDKVISGSFTAISQTLDIETGNSGTISVQVTGTWSGTIVLELSNDNSIWVQISLIKSSDNSQIASITSNDIYVGNTNSYAFIRLRTSAWTSGTASISSFGSDTISVLASGSATAANQSTQITALQILDDVPAAQNGAFVKGSPAMGQLDDTGTTAATEDNVSAIRITPQRALHSNLRNQAGTEVGTVAAPLTVAHPDIIPATQNITALDSTTVPFVGANGQVFYVGTPTTNSAVVFALSSENMVSVQASIIGAGGTLVVEISYDGGTNWIRPSVYQPGTQTYTNGYTAPFSGLVNTVAATHLRVRSTISWTGNATISIVRSMNQLDMKLIGIVSVVNSTSTPLAANATFTGTLEEVSDYASISVQIFTDQASATSGFKPQYSSDGTNWDDGDSYSIAITPAGNGKFFSFPPQAKYFRMIYTNGATLQTAFRMQTVFRRASIKPSSHRIGDTMDDENDAELVKAIVSARTVAGIHTNIEMTANKEVKVIDGLRSGGVHGAVSSTTANVAIEAKVGGARLTNRKLLIITVQSTGVFYGFDNTVTVANGTPAANNQVLSFNIDADSTFQVWLVSASTNRTFRILESP